MAFGREAVFERLWRLYVRGWAFYKTRLSENYSYSDFLSERPEESMQVMLITADRDVEFFSVQHDLEPKAGDTIVYFAPGRAKQSATEGGIDAQPAPA